MLTVRIQEKNYSESIMVLKLKDGKRVIFEPNAEMVAAIKSIAPRKVFTD